MICQQVTLNDLLNLQCFCTLLKTHDFPLGKWELYLKLLLVTQGFFASTIEGLSSDQLINTQMVELVVYEPHELFQIAEAICESCEYEGCAHKELHSEDSFFNSFGILVQPYDDKDVVSCKSKCILCTTIISADNQ